MSNEYKYYPALSDKIGVDTLPDFLSFIKDVFDDIYYKNYYESKNATGSSAFYSLDIVPRNRLEQRVFGTEMVLVLNPDYDDNTISSFPITIFWQWEILEYVRHFKASSFSFSPQALFDLAMVILRITKEQILVSAVNAFVVPQNPALSRFSQLVADINMLYSSNIVIDENDEDRYTQLITEVETLNENVYLTVFSLYLLTGTIEETLQNVQNFLNPFLRRDIKTYITDIITPKASASLNNISLALEFPRKWLIPIDPKTNQPIENEKIKSMLTFTAGSVRFSTENGLEFENESNFSFPKSQIGKTGITLYFEKMKLDLSRTRNIPEATAAGYPDDFVGVFVESVEIGLPEKWFKKVTSNNSTLGIFGENLLLGTGGISGTFGLRAIDTSGKPTNGAIPPNAEMEFTLGGNDGLIIGFSRFDFSLHMGNFQNTHIKGSLTIPGFKVKGANNSFSPAKIGIEMSFGNDGEFYITATETNGIPIEIPGVLEVKLKSVSVGKKDRNGAMKFYLSVSGSIEFTGEGMVSALFKDPLEIDQLIIWQDGTIELKGLDGAFKLKNPKTLQLGPAAITVTAVHFGSDERMHNGLLRKYWYFGCDGGVSVNPGGVDARGDGVKIYFTVDNNKNAGRPLHVFFRIQSISVDIIIPSSASSSAATAIISGYLAIKESESKSKPSETATEYIGGISLSLPKLNIMASAGMRYKPSVPAFMIDVSLDLPMAIPLGPTGIGIYGFRGLLGQRYVASREYVSKQPGARMKEDGSWYEYYKEKISPDYDDGEITYIAA